MTSELHIFIIWNNAYVKQNEILQDLEKKFIIRQIYEITWSKNLFSNNMTRFYGTNLPPDSFKEVHCGVGPFLLCIIEDHSPKHEFRETTTGKRLVNINTFDSKQAYRMWTGGGHKIHATDTEDESLHDLILLLGKNLSTLRDTLPPKWNGNVIKINSDLIGCDGWKNITTLFDILNATLKYVVLRNFENLSTQCTSEKHGDIDLLTDQFEQMQFITNATKVFSEKNRVLHYIKIGNKNVQFDFRYVGDNYYDPQWAKSILNNRIISSTGFYIPSLDNYFFSLLYHALIHKRTISEDYVELFVNLAQKCKIPDITNETFLNNLIPSEILSEYITKMDYNFFRPIDPSVFYNTEIIDFPNGFETSTQSIVNELYKQILERPVDKEGLQYYSSMLENKKMSISDVKKSLIDSDEYKSLK